MGPQAKAQGQVDPGAHRRAHAKAASLLERQFRTWRSGRDEGGNPAPQLLDYRMRLSPYSTEYTPPMGQMSDWQIRYYALEISRRDMERAINMRREAMPRAKQRAGEAA